jgi:beta-glucosidase
VETDDFLLTAAEQSIVRRVSEAFHNAGKKVVVVLNIGGVIETASWKPHADAILLAWQGGQEGGHAVADILDGSVTPSGKLPMTFPVNLKDHGSSANFPMDGEPINLTEAFLGVEEKPISERVKNKDYTLYEEGIYVGYRHFDKQKINVSYPFGFGLSYTEFQYANMEVTLEKGWLDIGLWVKNTGTVPGKEVVQLYSAKPATAVDRPVRELRAFSKTPLLRPGDSTQLKFTLPVSELAYWNEAHPGWEVEPGAYSLEAGASSRDLRLAQEVEIPSTGGMEDY